MNTYDPRDPNSSPYEPIMGDIVIYKTGRGIECFPAIITKSYEGDLCDLTIFTTTGLRYAIRVRYCTDVESGNTWHWAPTKTERKPVKFDEDEDSAVEEDAVETVDIP